MQSVFVAGSPSIKVLPKLFAERLGDLVSSGLEFLVGDGNGPDKAVQELLLARETSAVIVFCVAWPGRNNLGRWPIQIVNNRARKGSTKVAAATDVAMAATADFGLMIWDGKSTAVLMNVIELTKHGKKSVMFIEPTASFVVIRNAIDLVTLVDLMPKGARANAEDKIALSDKLSELMKLDG